MYLADKYNVSSIVLFGTSAISTAYNDIDIGVTGLAPNLFFKFYGELMRYLSKPVDLVDLTLDSLFNRVVKEKGVIIYGTTCCS